MNYDPKKIIRVGTDLRFVDSSKPWDKVSISLGIFLARSDTRSGGTKTTLSTMAFKL